MTWFGPPPPPDWSFIGRAAVKIALGEVGRGEQSKDNDGPDVRKYARMDRSPGNWCAAFVCWCIEEACKSLNLPCPVKRTHGAKALWRRCIAAGGKPERPAPGDVVCWHRGLPGAWTGHVALVSRVEVDGGGFWCVEGNRGRYPSKVREYGHELGEDRLLGFARLA